MQSAKIALQTRSSRGNVSLMDFESTFGAALATMENHCDQSGASEASRIVSTINNNTFASFAFIDVLHSVLLPPIDNRSRMRHPCHHSSTSTCMIQDLRQTRARGAHQHLEPSNTHVAQPPSNMHYTASCTLLHKRQAAPKPIVSAVTKFGLGTQPNITLFLLASPTTGLPRSKHPSKHDPSAL